MTDFGEIFAEHRIMVILRGVPTVAETVAAAQRAWDAGVELLEVPIGEPEQVAALVEVVNAGAKRGKSVGAGTVVSTDQVKAATDAGARYTVAPGFDSAVAETSAAAGLPHMPGVATATEVQRARAAGCRWLKVFPAVTLGPAWFRALRGPFPDMQYLATGGVTIEAASSYLNAGARIVAFGASATENANRDALRELLCRAVSATI